MELEQFIVNTGQSKDNIHSDYNDYCALKKGIDNPDSLHDNDDIRRMKDLHNVFQMGMNIHNRQNKINAARKVAAAAAAAATIATFNLANTSNVTNTSISTFASSQEATLLLKKNNIYKSTVLYLRNIKLVLFCLFFQI
jgi:hypothetical protein